MALNKIEKLSPWRTALSTLVLSAHGHHGGSKRSAAIGSILLVTAMFAACGDEVTEVTQVVGMQVVEEGESMPKCTTEKEGQMVYSVDSAAAYYCINRKWTSMKGEDGKDGKNGTNGTNGKNGSDGTSCSAVEIEDGYKIVCGDDSVGVVLNGTNGENGEKGKNGDKGADGKNCEIVSDSSGVITLKCGDDTTTLYKAVCNLTPYDPMKQYCSVHGIYDLEKCGDKLYNPESHFCDTRDSSLYRYVAIGLQVWMAENLNYKVDSSYCYNDSIENCEKYGRLYQWAAAVGKSESECGFDNTCSLPSGNIQGVCPSGWHLPSKAEWETLFNAVGGRSTAGKVLKSTSGWNSSGNGTDVFGFLALPAGSRGSDAHFWSSTENGSVGAYVMYLAYNSGSAYLGSYGKNYGFSVRCLQD